MFQQTAPNLGNQFEDDRVLRSYLARVLPADMRSDIEPELKELGQLAGGELYQMQLADRLNEPTLTQWDAWGNRVDRVEVTRVWREAERIAVDYGVVATAYEQKHGSLSRVHQCALAYLFTPSTDIYSCPLAMTDGAARTLLGSGNQALIDRAVPHLITRKHEEFWTSGQWMTEITGGSDVGLSQTVAVRDPVQSPANAKCETRNSELEAWRLYGNKWFASAITSQIALTLARPEGNPPGGRGLALFYVELRNEAGRLRNIEIDRLKDKLGTRKVPTAELTLAGTPAQLVKGTTDGVRNIAPLLNITRLWNGISAVALMRRGLALADDYARRRIAFGAPLAEKPLHRDTLGGLQAEFEGAFYLAFYVAELTGRSEMGELSETDSHLLRLLTPVMKLTTAKQAVMVLSEVVEALGGAGYVEDTGLPQLLRDAQVLPIWEGTTNVLSLDALRALHVQNSTSNVNQEASGQPVVQSPTSNVQSHPNTGTAGVPPASPLQAFKAAVSNCLTEANDPQLTQPVRITRAAMDHTESWLTRVEDQEKLEAGARRFALTLGRTMESALLIRHAQWSRNNEADDRSIASARRFAKSGIDLLTE
jgi:alkylation response protein AidB-like acyl-CoA dehydrogenase